MFELPYPTDFALGGEGRLMDLDLQHYEIIFRGRIQSNVEQTTKTNEFGKGQIQNRVKFSCVGGGGVSFSTSIFLIFILHQMTPKILVVSENLYFPIVGGRR